MPDLWNLVFERMRAYTQTTYNIIMVKSFLYVREIIPLCDICAHDIITYDAGFFESLTIYDYIAFVVVVTMHRFH